MKLNLKKCGVLFLGKRNKKKYNSVEGIDIVDNYKFLGIELNAKL